MALLVWITLGVALWHFTVFVPDKFVGGIVGAFLAAIVGAMVSGALWQVAQGDTLGETDVLTFLAAVPGCLIALAIVYVIGVPGHEPPPAPLRRRLSDRTNGQIAASRAGSVLERCKPDGREREPVIDTVSRPAVRLRGGAADRRRARARRSGRDRARPARAPNGRGGARVPRRHRDP